MSTDFEVKVEGVRELRAALRDYPKIAEPILQRAVEATNTVFGKHTLRNNPVPWRTGNLLMSFRFAKARLQARWFPRAAYAPFVELGTKPHTIVPVKAQALRWESGGSAGYVTSRTGRRRYQKTAGTATFAMRVNHPGTKAKPFMQRIVTNSAPDVQKLMWQALNLINKEIANRTRQS